MKKVLVFAAVLAGLAALARLFGRPAGPAAT
jgi:hypothetical protein